jgi:type III secretion protein V
LVETIRDQSGDAGIKLPPGGREGGSAHSPMTLPPDPLVLEVGDELMPLFAGDEGASPFLDEMVPMMRDGLFYELGVQFPGLRLSVGADVPPSSARITINGVPEKDVEVRPDWVMVNDRVDAMVERGFAAEPVVNPATDTTGTLIPAHEAEAAEDLELTIWDAHGYVTLALSSVLRRKAAHFIGMDEAQAMLKQIEPFFPLLIAETVPKTVSLFVLTDVLRRLVAEGVSIRNLRSILMALAEWGRVENDPLMLTEYVRAALRRQITYKLRRGSKVVVAFLLHPDIETEIRGATRHTATGSYVDLEPDRLREILDAIQEPLDVLPEHAQVPEILTTMEIRSTVRRLVALKMPKLHVVSYHELRPETNIYPVGRISLDGFESRRGGVSVGGVQVWG